MAGRSDEDLAIAARAAFDDPVCPGVPRTQPGSQARAAMNVLPAWAHWNPAAADAPWTVGVEEEVMLVDPGDWSLASASRAYWGATRSTSTRSTCCCAAGHSPEPTFLWWDLRPQPKLGTIEVHILDAQTRA
jgi:hypothetical protein